MRPWEEALDPVFDLFMTPTIKHWEKALTGFRIPYTQRKTTGAIYILCPFHREKTPSFRIWSDSARFKCFGCGRIGDLGDFLQKMVGVIREVTSEELLREFCSRRLDEDENRHQLWFDITVVETW